MMNLADVLDQILTDAIHTILSVTQVECLCEMLHPHTHHHDLDLALKLPGITRIDDFN